MTRRLAFVSGLLLAAFCGVLAEDSLLHTDDGCVVERHCLACRTLVSPPSPAAAPVVVAPTLTSVASHSPSSALVRGAQKVGDGPSRAPPVA